MNLTFAPGSGPGGRLLSQFVNGGNIRFVRNKSVSDREIGKCGAFCKLAGKDSCFSAKMMFAPFHEILRQPA